MNEVAAVYKNRPKTVVADMTPKQIAREERLRKEQEELEALIAQETQNRNSKNGESKENPDNDDQREADSESDGADDGRDDSFESDRTESEDIIETEQIEEDPEETERKAPKKESTDDVTDDKFEKRFKDSQRYITKLKEENKKLKEELEAKGETQASTIDPETINQWRKKYPHVEAIISQLAEEKALTMRPELAKLKEQIEELTIKARLEKNEAQLADKHPDYKKIRASDAFHNWVEKKPEWVRQTLYDSDDVESISEILTLYKTSTGYGQAKPKKSDQSRDAAKASTGRAQSTSIKPQENKLAYDFKESQIAAMSDKQFAENSEAILKAQRENRILYDISRN